MPLFNDLANLLDATADQLDARIINSVMKTAAVSEDPMQNIATAYETAFGAPPTKDILQKIANDPQLLDTFFKLAEHASTPDSLGGPSDRNDSTSTPTSKVDRLKAAENRFENWLRDG
jgi:hypothetical protein